MQFLHSSTSVVPQQHIVSGCCEKHCEQNWLSVADGDSREWEPGEEKCSIRQLPHRGAGGSEHLQVWANADVLQTLQSAEDIIDIGDKRDIPLQTSPVST